MLIDLKINMKLNKNLKIGYFCTKPKILSPYNDSLVSSPPFSCWVSGPGDWVSGLGLGFGYLPRDFWGPLFFFVEFLLWFEV